MTTETQTPQDRAAELAQAIDDGPLMPASLAGATGEAVAAYVGIAGLADLLAWDDPADKLARHRQSIRQGFRPYATGQAIDDLMAELEAITLAAGIPLGRDDLAAEMAALERLATGHRNPASAAAWATSSHDMKAAWAAYMAALADLATYASKETPAHAADTLALIGNLAAQGLQTLRDDWGEHAPRAAIDGLITDLEAITLAAGIPLEGPAAR